MRLLPSVSGLTRGRSKLGDALVVGPAQLVVDFRLHGCALDLVEPVAAEEAHLERQHEHAADAEFARVLEQPGDHQVADALAPQPRLDRHRADLGEVLPHHVDRATADNPAVQLDNDEVGYVLEQRDQLLPQQDALLDVALDEPLDLAHVGRAGAADDGGHGIGGYEAVVYSAAHAGTNSAMLATIPFLALGTGIGIVGLILVVLIVLLLVRVL
jgi:hypothetical protein